MYRPVETDHLNSGLALFRQLGMGGRKDSPSEAKPSQARPGQARPGQARPGQAWPWTNYGRDKVWLVACLGSVAIWGYATFTRRLGEAAASWEGIAVRAPTFHLLYKRKVTENRGQGSRKAFG